MSNITKDNYLQELFIDEAKPALSRHSGSGGGGSSESEIETYFQTQINGGTFEANLPNVTLLKAYAFYYDSALVGISMPKVTNIGGRAFENCTNLKLTSLPSGLTYISTASFYNCKKISITRIPRGVTFISNQAFYNCVGLTTLTFEGSAVTTIKNNTFSNCTNLTTINVPWAEGEVADAPWGATNATINYNYTGG